MQTNRSLWHIVGPGILFAGAAVGVSHLVQSTRAGATYGLTLVLFVVLANLVKYPAFRFGPEYSAATGLSLLEGYRRRGRWALALYALLTVATMFTIEAAVAVVTAGLAAVLFGIEASPVVLAGGLIALSAGILALGEYRWLDRIAKVVVVILTLATLVATALALPKLDWAETALWPDAAFFADKQAIFFLAALVGWMPSAIDVAAWQSLWGLAKVRETGRRPARHEALLDFHLGYWGAAALAICFLVMGAAVMHGSGQTFAPTAGGFAAQVIALYTETLGEWSRPVIGTAAFAVMFSTTLTVVDGFPRALSVLVARFRTPEDPARAEAEEAELRRLYWGSLVVVGAGSVGVLALLLTSLAFMVDLATTLSFLTAPMLAALNHMAMTSDEVPPAWRLRPWLRRASLASIAVLSVFAAYFVYLRFLS